LVGVGLAVLLELVDTSIKTPRDIARHTRIPILGTVPDTDDEELPIDVVELSAHTAPRSMIAEAFRAIRTNLLLSSPAERQRALLVTSAKPEEGKTTIATNLAISLAQNNRRVLLIDANFHRPALGNFFKKTNSQGLSQILIGQGAMQDYVAGTELPNLDVLGSGPVPPNPAELLAGSHMQELIRQATEHYDQVIFDGPPILLLSDAMVLAGSVDGLILVCRAKSTSRGVIQRARDNIERASIRVFGVVLNAAQVTRGGYFREQIRSYYDYQPTESLTNQANPALPTQDQKGDAKDEPEKA
jgi:capsular exopolysaccharide synthesis family protein